MEGYEKAKEVTKKSYEKTKEVTKKGLEKAKEAVDPTGQMDSDWFKRPADFLKGFDAEPLRRALETTGDPTSADAGRVRPEGAEGPRTARVEIVLDKRFKVSNVDGGTFQQIDDALKGRSIISIQPTEYA